MPASPPPPPAFRLEGRELVSANGWKVLLGRDEYKKLGRERGSDSAAPEKAISADKSLLLAVCLLPGFAVPGKPDACLGVSVKAAPFIPSLSPPLHRNTVRSRLFCAQCFSSGESPGFFPPTRVVVHSHTQRLYNREVQPMFCGVHQTWVCHERSSGVPWVSGAQPLKTAKKVST